MAVQTYPTIISFDGRTDSGEYGGDCCGHCSAQGRYQFLYTAMDSEGKIVKGRAMAGCIKLFPVSPLAKKQQALMLKLEEYTSKGWNLNRADTDSLAAIDEVMHCELSIEDALARIRKNDAGMAQWRKNRQAR